MSTDKALERRQAGQLAQASPTSLIDAYQILDVYAGGVSDEPARVESIATISAGFRGAGSGDRPGAPQRSRDGTIYLHDATGRAAGLKRALDASGGKRLTIAFPFDDPRLFIHARFMRYSASALEAFGDETHLMVQAQGRGYARVELEAVERRLQRHIETHDLCRLGIDQMRWVDSGRPVVVRVQPCWVQRDLKRDLARLERRAQREMDALRGGGRR